MQANLNSKDLHSTIKALGATGVLGVLLYVGIQQVVSHEISIEGRMVTMETKLDNYIAADAKRYADYMVAQRSIVAWLRTNCYAAANGDAAARGRCEETDKQLAAARRQGSD